MCSVRFVQCIQQPTHNHYSPLVYICTQHTIHCTYIRRDIVRIHTHATHTSPTTPCMYADHKHSLLTAKVITHGSTPHFAFFFDGFDSLTSAILED